MSVRRKIKGLKECLWLKWADYVWTNCGLPTSEPFYIFGEFPTIWVFMRNKATFIIAVKIDRLLLSQPLWQLWYRSWASHEQRDTPTLGLQTSDSENRETLSWWLWWQQLPGQHHQQHQAAENKANTSSGHASHRVVFSRGSSDGPQGWFCGAILTVALAFLWSHPHSKSGAEILQWFYQTPDTFSIACLDVS